jgi:hypothetical protein
LDVSVSSCRAVAIARAAGSPVMRRAALAADFDDPSSDGKVKIRSV